MENKTMKTEQIESSPFPITSFNKDNDKVFTFTITKEFVRELNNERLLAPPAYILTLRGKIRELGNKISELEKDSRYYIPPFLFGTSKREYEKNNFKEISRYEKELGELEARVKMFLDDFNPSNLISKWIDTLAIYSKYDIYSESQCKNCKWVSRVDDIIIGEDLYKIIITYKRIMKFKKIEEKKIIEVIIEKSDIEEIKVSGLKLEIKIIERKIGIAYKLEYYEMIRSLIDYRDNLKELLDVEVNWSKGLKKDKEIERLIKIGTSSPFYIKDETFKEKEERYNKLK